MPELSIRRLLIKNTGAQMIAQAVSLVIGFATSFVLSRHLGVEGFGQFNYIFAFFYFFLTLNDFGVNTIVVREVSKNSERANEIIGAMLSFKVFLATVSVLSAWVAIWLMRFPEQLRNALFVFALILPAIALQLPSVIFQALLKIEYPAIIGIISRCLGFLLLMCAVWRGYGLTAMASALVVAEFILLIMLLKYARKFVKPVWKLDPALWKHVLRSSIPLGTAGLFVGLINRVDFLMLERMTDLHQVGLYSAAYKITNILEAFPIMIMGTLYPLMSRYAKEDTIRLRELHTKSVFYLGAIAIPMGICVTVFAPIIVRLIFGEKFVGADRGLMVLVWSTVFIYLAMSKGYLLISVGREKVNLYIFLGGSILNIGLNLLWIPIMGFTGAALSTVASFCLIFVGQTVAVRLFLGSEEATCAESGSPPKIKLNSPNERTI